MPTAARPTTKPVLAAVAAAVVFAGTYGFAASLGISQSGLGAGNNVVAACGTGTTFAYTTAYYPGTDHYDVNGIDLSNIPTGCLSKSLSVTFYDSSDTAVGSEVSVTLPASGTTDSISIMPNSNAIDAGQVGGVSVVVS
jgi:hypothetical protein